MWWITWALAEPVVIGPEACAAAKAYNAAHGGQTLLVRVDDVVVCEDYPGGDEPRELASGTKSFSGLLALALAQRGQLDLDERVSGTLVEWGVDPNKQAITVRQLLSLVSGLDTRPLGMESWTEAIAAPTFAAPGEDFRYGSAPFQVFGALVERKTGRDPVDLLKEYVLDPIGVDVAGWRERRGHPTMAYGAKLSASEWAKVGELVRHGGRAGGVEVLRADLLGELTRGSEAAPFYGLSWWLFRVTDRALAQRWLITRVLPTAPDRAVPSDLVMAAGAGDQRLYVSVDAHLVVVRQTDNVMGALVGRDLGWSDLAFLRALLPVR